MVEVARLIDPDMLVEIEAEAIVPVRLRDARQRRRLRLTPPRKRRAWRAPTVCRLPQSANVPELVASPIQVTVGVGL